MYIRVTRLKISPDQVDAGIRNFKETVVPAGKGQPGFVGAAMVINHDEGTAAGLTYWESLEALNASEQMGIDARLQARRASGAEVIDVDRLELVLAHRPSGPVSSGFNRLTEIAGDPRKLDEAIAFVRDKVVPNVSGQPGFRSLQMSVNRMTGRGVVVSTWESAAAREASEAAIKDQREQAAKIAGSSIARVTKGELVYAEVRQPAVI